MWQDSTATFGPHFVFACAASQAIKIQIHLRVRIRVGVRVGVRVRKRRVRVRVRVLQLMWSTVRSYCAVHSNVRSHGIVTVRSHVYAVMEGRRI